MLNVRVMQVTSESGVSEDNEGEPDDYNDYEFDSDGDYSKIIIVTIPFFVILGPPVTYYICRFYTKRHVGFLRIMSLFYWFLFWIFALFAITCTFRSCGQYSKSQHIFDLFGFILMPIFWVVFIVESWLSRERFCIAKLKCTGPVLKHITRLKIEQPKITWTVKCYHYENR